ncbi:putative transcription factor interactor and regulator CCHC(Zn) family [Helianthus anomalus]
MCLSRNLKVSGESVEALIGRFAELLSMMKKAAIMVSTHMSNKKLLDALKRIPDQPKSSWFGNVNQIVLTTNCYRMKPDELISLIKSYDKADKQKAQGNTFAALCSSTPADSLSNSESGCCTGTQIHEFTHTPTKAKSTAEDSAELEQNECNSSSEFICVNNTDASTSCANEVKVEYWVEGDDVVCQETADVHKKFEKSANKSSNRSYNSNSSSVGSNGSGYAPYVKKQTCYNCGIPGHIVRNCTHRPYVPYYKQNQRVASREKSYSK